MTAPPVLHTQRLTLRPFTADDAPAVQELVSEREIALNTLSIPHPYPEGGAAAWIASHEEKFAAGDLHFALVDGAQIVGAMALLMKPEHDRAEIGYWIGVPYWARGYASEAVGALLAYAFEQTNLARVYAAHFARNPASGKVMAKNGMKHEGTLRKHVKKWGELLDIEHYGILREEWTEERRTG